LAQNVHDCQTAGSLVDLQFAEAQLLAATTDSLRSAAYATSVLRSLKGGQKLRHTGEMKRNPGFGEHLERLMRECEEESEGYRDSSLPKSDSEEDFDDEQSESSSEEDSSDEDSDDSFEEKVGTSSPVMEAPADRDSLQALSSQLSRALQTQGAAAAAVAPLPLSPPVTEADKALEKGIHSI